jgi:hypothetical protein
VLTLVAEITGLGIGCPENTFILIAVLKQLHLITNYFLFYYKLQDYFLFYLFITFILFVLQNDFLFYDKLFFYKVQD